MPLFADGKGQMVA
ncbi:hypothetical protein Nmel_014462, partial [Mimus melanotis]